MDSIVRALRPRSGPALGTVVSVLADRWVQVSAGGRSFVARWEGDAVPAEGQGATIQWTERGPVVSGLLRYDDEEPIDAEIPA